MVAKAIRQRRSCWVETLGLWRRLGAVVSGAAVLAGLGMPLAWGTVPAAAAAAAASTNTPTARATVSRAARGPALPAPPKGTTVVADNGILRLAVNMKTTWFQLVDERNGAVWTSGPRNPSQYAQNGHWQNILSSDFLLGRTTTERENALPDLSATGPYPDDGGVATTHRIPNGVAIDYNYTQDKIKFQGDLTINGSTLVASVPWKSIKEQNCPRFTPPPPTMSLILFYFPPECYEVTDIHVLPAFGYGQPGTPGYAVLPDGSGAIVNYAKDHPIYTLDYMAPVYGDPSQIPGFDEWYPEASMPVFGQVHLDPQHPAGSAAVLGVATKDAADAVIQMVPAGRQANLYLTSADFTYRPLYAQDTGSGPPVYRYTWHPISGNRQVTYYFMDGSQATYAGLALRYRQYLIDTKHVKPLTPQPRAPFILHIFDGARATGVLFDPLQPATTFSEAQQMISDLEQQGVTSLRVTLEGWMRSGWDWISLPFIWPPAGALGGTGGLRALANWGSAHHAPIVLALDLYQAYKNGLGYNARYKAIHTPDDLLLQDFNTISNQALYLISPDVANQTLLPPLIRDAQQVGAAGMDFEYFARNVYPNYQPQHMLTRTQSINQWMQMVNSARKTLGNAGVQGGNTYAVGHAQYFYNAPTADSGFDYETRAIPVWEIAVHGLALYSGVESNLRSQPALQELQMIEDGALPDWELTWQPANVLRYTNYYFLYSSQFSQWESQAVAEYKQEVASGYSRLAYVAIVNNEQLQPGVDETDYADGSRVLVNYNSTPVTLKQYHNVVVPALGYRVIPGGVA